MSFLDLKYGSPGVSYLYSSRECHSYRFPDQMDKFSILPACEVNGKKITFTYTNKYVVQCENEFIKSTKEAIKKIGLPKSRNQNELDKMAIIINFLSEGMNYSYIDQTATLDPQEEKMTFIVKKESSKTHYRVSFAKNEVHYELSARAT